jgi:hypothetical protein
MTTHDRDRLRGSVVQDYRSESEAIQAIRRLQAAGFGDADISVIARDRDVARGVAADTGTEAEEGAVAGAVAGGALGALAALIAGASAVAIPGVGIAIGGPIAAAIAGAAGGGLLGGLVGMGIPEEEAKVYDERFKAGHVLVTVAAGSRADEARGILIDGNVQGIAGIDQEFVVDDRDRGSSGNTILDQSIGSAAGVATSTGTATGMATGGGPHDTLGSGLATGSGPLGRYEPRAEPDLTDDITDAFIPDPDAPEDRRTP